MQKERLILGRGLSWRRRRCRTSLINRARLSVRVQRSCRGCGLRIGDDSFGDLNPGSTEIGMLHLAGRIYGIIMTMGSRFFEPTAETPHPASSPSLAAKMVLPSQTCSAGPGDSRYRRNRRVAMKVPPAPDPATLIRFRPASETPSRSIPVQASSSPKPKERMI